MLRAAGAAAAAATAATAGLCQAPRRGESRHQQHQQRRQRRMCSPKRRQRVRQQLELAMCTAAAGPSASPWWWSRLRRQQARADHRLRQRPRLQQHPAEPGCPSSSLPQRRAEARPRWQVMKAGKRQGKPARSTGSQQQCLLPRVSNGSRVLSAVCSSSHSSDSRGRHGDKSFSHPRSQRSARGSKYSTSHVFGPRGQPLCFQLPATAPRLPWPRRGTPRGAQGQRGCRFCCVRQIQPRACTVPQLPAQRRCPARLPSSPPSKRSRCGRQAQAVAQPRAPAGRPT
jgi:hypothetical protein